jgi:hypothetical protein
MRITLQPSEGATMAPGNAVRVQCLAGVLWITNHGDSKDRVLKAGDSAELCAAQRRYLSSVGRNEAVSFEVSGPAASISLHRAGGDGGGAFSGGPGGRLRQLLPQFLPQLLRGLRRLLD